MRKDQALFHRHEGRLHFRGLRIERRQIDVGGRTFEMAALADASELLDLPEYAERFVQHDRAPYGLELWPAATMLADYAMGEPPPEGGAIEIGAGLGLVSIAAAAAGWSVVASDREEESLRFTAYNARLNGVRLAGYQMVDWNHPPTDRRYRCVLAADVLYQVVDHTPLLRCLDVMLAGGGTAIVADPNRGVADRFTDAAKANGFEVEIRLAASENHRGDEVAGRLFLLRRL